MVKIRLRRTGAKKQPSYRVVIADSRAPRDGSFIEIVGHYNPRTIPVTFKVEEDRVLYWLSEGAQPTDTVRRLLKNLGTLERFARLKAGADLEELLAEAKATREESMNEAQAQPKAPVPEETELKADDAGEEPSATADEAAEPAETPEAVSVEEDEGQEQG